MLQEIVNSKEADYRKGFDLISILCPKTDTIYVLVIREEPSAKRRPRKGKHGKFYAPDSKEQNAVSWRLKGLVNKPMSSNVAVGCIFYRSNRQRIDVDNLLKFVVDAGTGICYYDDDQVTAQMGILEYDPENPRTIIAIGEHSSSMDRSYRKKECENCSKAFSADNPNRKYCSRKCAALSRGEDLTALKRCPICELDFKRRTVKQIYCSNQCRYEARRQRTDKRRKHTIAYCRDCGKEVSRPSYARCRSCWLIFIKSSQKT